MTINIIITLGVPIIVIAYIVWDLISHNYTVKIPEMSCDKGIENIIHESGRNHGDRLTQEKILDNTKYLLKQYNDVL
jgi:uncharacterized protein YebE (UPF0316 family)